MLETWRVRTGASGRGLGWLLLGALLAAACGGETPGPGGAPGSSDASEATAAEARPEGPLSPTAQPELHASLVEAAALEHHPSDGGGRAWLEQAEGDPDFAVARQPGRFGLVFEVGPQGIASGGEIHFQVSPFWEWSTPQVEVEDAYGYTTIEPSAEDIELEVATLDQQLLGLHVAGRALRPGERIRIVYGAGAAGAMADRNAEAHSRFWFAVDGDGDGVRAFLPDSPGIEVRPGAAAQLHIALPSVARPGERVRITVAVLDALGNAGVPWAGEITFPEAPSQLELPEAIVLTEEDAGRGTLEARALESGVARVRAETADGLRAESNPLLVSAEGPRVYWGDLHGHSALSDGTGTPEGYFRYARDVAGLDVVALTDHDHWGIQPLDSHPEHWERIRETTGAFHEPGRFVTILGYEWTSWLHGHRHVLYFEEGEGEGVVHSSIDPATESPRQLWDALRGTSALTFAHHSAGGPVATNWEIPPDPELEPVTEIVSVHGSSEAADSPVPIYSAVPGNTVRDALGRGYRFGFIGSGDSHDGHPGLTQLGGPTGGLAAILAGELTRDGVRAALRARRVYATNGPRILLRTALGPHPMGTRIPAPETGAVSEELFVHVVAEAPLERVDLVRSGRVVDSAAIDGLLEATLARPVEELRSGEYVYVRAVQEDDGAAWSSPIYVE